ncbi:hypothetical protein HAX54_042605 [Datura stramonium]|uniref:C2H2-type domain-containing protein n=1 Tax=Datura stramonium TaxID=4076 RepID=A0ABS8RNT4_DATST|nr:hypothetical protein [Datura stramonium]
MAIKRSREEEEEELTVEKLAMANCVNILQKNSSLARRFYECKTCKKLFESFQALGGHRASHKKPKLVTGVDPIKSKKKKHICSYCGEEFTLGQALGGHMRKHRDKLKEQDTDDKSAEFLKAGEEINLGSKKKLFLDLNLTPYENDLMLGIIPFTANLNCLSFFGFQS